MSIKEQVAQALETLNDSELHQVAEYLSFLKFRSRFQRRPSVALPKIAELYEEFGHEDQELAEEGMEEYMTELFFEDSK
jgi:hypothetical protein